MARSSRIALVAVLLLLAGGLPGAAAGAARHSPAPAAHPARHSKVVRHRRKARPRQASAAAGVKAPPPAVTDCADGDLLPTPANVDRVRAATFCLVNRQRALQGIAPLRVDLVLAAAAQGHSADMVARDYFDHVAPNGASVLDRALAAGYIVVAGTVGLGENLATGSGTLATPAATVVEWMASPGHRANILNRAFTDAGMGVVAATPALLGAGGGGATYTEDFGAEG